MQNLNDNDDWQFVHPIELVRVELDDDESDDEEEIASNDPYEGFRFLDLPVHLQIHIIAMLEKDSLLNMTAVCKVFGRIVSPIITQKLMLAIKLIATEDRGTKSISDMFAAFLENASHGRCYSKLALKNLQWALNTDFQSLVLYALSVVGESVSDLVVCETNFASMSIGVSLLQCFKFVSKLTLTAVNIYTKDEVKVHHLLPNLKQLVMDRTFPKIISWFHDCDQLEEFEFELDDFDHETFNENPKILENFVIQQTRLKTLTLINLQHVQLFNEDRSKEVEFQLESITLYDTYFTNQVNALKFFKTQREVKFFEYLSFEENESVNDGLLAYIYGMTSLKRLRTSCGVNDITNFRINPTMKRLEFSRHVACLPLVMMMKIFPNLDDIYLETTYLKLHDFATEKLCKIKVLDSMRPGLTLISLTDFRYQVPVINVSQRDFEIMLKCFLMRNRKIKSLVIGHSIWIENNFGVSLRFCQDVLKYLPELNTLEIFNPKQIKFLVMLLMSERRSFLSITLHTNEAGKASVARMGKRFLKIVVV